MQSCSAAKAAEVLLRSHTISHQQCLGVDADLREGVHGAGHLVSHGAHLGVLVGQDQLLSEVLADLILPLAAPNDDPQTLTKTPVFEPSRMAGGSALPHLNFRPVWAQKTRKNPVKV